MPDLSCTRRAERVAWQVPSPLTLAGEAGL